MIPYSLRKYQRKERKGFGINWEGRAQARRTEVHWNAGKKGITKIVCFRYTIRVSVLQIRPSSGKCTGDSENTRRHYSK